MTVSVKLLSLNIYIFGAAKFSHTETRNLGEFSKFEITKRLTVYSACPSFLENVISCTIGAEQNALNV